MLCCMAFCTVKNNTYSGESIFNDEGSRYGYIFIKFFLQQFSQKSIIGIPTSFLCPSSPQLMASS